MSETRSERRKIEIARAKLKKKTDYKMRIGLPFDTEEGKKVQAVLK